MLKAIYWHNKAAEQGWVFASSALAVIYERGEGVPQDFLQAYMWWAIAAALGHAYAEQNQAEIALKMTVRQVSKAQSSANEWLKNRRFTAD